MHISQCSSGWLGVTADIFAAKKSSSLVNYRPSLQIYALNDKQVKKGMTVTASVMGDVQTG
jgi:hypothetical protein